MWGSGFSADRGKPNIMGKCVVTGCPNRMATNNRGVFNRPTRRFFRFPKDSDRVKVWLAALRETDKDPAEQHIICEDHFLPEDVSRKGVSSDAIPLMPSYLDGPQALVSSWSRESSQEDEQWPTAGCEDEGGEEAPPAPGPPQQDLDGGEKNPSQLQMTSETSSRSVKPGTPLSVLTRGFMELLMATPNASVDVEEVAANLQTPVYRLNNIISILFDIGLVQKESDSAVKWVGSGPICSFLWRDPLRFLMTLERLRRVENELDALIKSCAEQLFSLTDDVENSASAYVTLEDMVRLRDLQDQTLIVIRAPEQTKLNVPPPDKKDTRLHLMAESGPITALTCEVGSGDALTSDPTGSSLVFSSVEKSRIRTYGLHRDQNQITWRDGGSEKPLSMGPRCQSATCTRTSRRQCSYFTEADRERIFRGFWEKMNWKQRQQHVCSLVDVVPRHGAGSASRSANFFFYLNDNGQRRRVCRALFLSTLGLRDWYVLGLLRDRLKSSQLQTSCE